jgi:hypothetical protein
MNFPFQKYLIEENDPEISRYLALSIISILNLIQNLNGQIYDAALQLFLKFLGFFLQKKGAELKGGF